jgi:hypothetical protein
MSLHYSNSVSALDCFVLIVYYLDSLEGIERASYIEGEYSLKS